MDNEIEDEGFFDEIRMIGPPNGINFSSFTKEEPPLQLTGVRGLRRMS